MKRRNLIGSLLAGAGVLLTGRTLRASSPARTAGPQADREESANGSSETAHGSQEATTGSPATATVRVIYANATQASWEAVTNGGILVAGATNVTPGNAAFANLQIIHDAVTAIVAAGGPTLTQKQIALFGGQS